MTTERTQLASNSDDLATLIAEAEIEAETAEAMLSPESQVGTIVQSPTPGAPLASRINTITDAGWVRVYRTSTGDMSMVNRNMLAMQLQKLDPDTGERAFTTRKPDIEPKRGTLKCWLHADGQIEDEFGEYGFGVCAKSNLISQYEVEEHVRRKHPREYASINSQRERRREDATAARQDRLIEAVLSGRVSPQEAQVEVVPVEEEANNQSGVGFSNPCPTCNEMLDAKNRGGWNLKLRSHNRREHPEG